jgi:hypothetical protein
MFEVNSTNYYTLEYTFQESSLSCWVPFYYAHVAFAYLIFLAGIGAFLTRTITKFNFLHAYFGKLYIVFMLWGTATSLLVHNKGLPTGVLYSFLWVLVGLTVGWVAIIIHQKWRRELLPKNGSKFMILVYKMCSLKGFHGCIMFVSWINIAGRLFITPLNANFECYAASAYKPINSTMNTYKTGDPITFLPSDDPAYARLPWAYKEKNWAAMMLLATYFGAFVVGCIYVFFSIPTKASSLEAKVESEKNDVKEGLVKEVADKENVGNELASNSQ